jgi:hypothetical protein
MRHMGKLALASLLAGGLVLSGAEAQKPPPAGTPAPPSSKPAPAPPPTQGPAVPGKPPAGGAPPATPQTPGGPTPQTPGTPTPQTPPPRAQAPNATPPIDEPTAVGRLRSLLGPDATLAYARAEVTDPARGTVRLSGVTITPRGDQPIGIETLALDDLRDDGLGEAEARKITINAGATSVVIERMQVAGLNLRNPAAGQPRTPDLVALDSLRVEGFVLTNTDASGLRVDQASLEDYGPGRQTRVALGGMTLQVQPGQDVQRVTLRRAVVRGLDLAVVATAASRNQPPPTAGRIALELEEAAAVGTGGRSLGSLGSLRVTSDQPENGVGIGSVALRALRLEPIAGADVWMQRLGYTNLLFDLTADSRYDPAGGRIDLTSMSLVGRDMGTLSLAFSGDGAATSAMQRGDFAGLRLISAGLRYIDQGLVGRLIGQQARSSNTPEPQLREQYANMAGGALAQPALAPVREALQRFIRGQAREVEVTLHPAQPVAILELQQRPPANPADAVARLGLGAVAR